MSEEGRSNLIDVSYSQLHLVLSGHQEGLTPDQVKELLVARKSVLQNVCKGSVFGLPSQESRKKIESGSVNLTDGVTARVEDAEKQFVLAISSKFNIDEIQAFILFRSFLFNQGLPAITSKQSKDAMVEEVLTAIGPFYYSERLYAINVLGPLFRAYGEDSSDSLSDIAFEFLPTIIPDPVEFTIQLINAYTAKTSQVLPESIMSTNDPKLAMTWAKRSLRDQLALLELLFWIMWGYAPCTASIVLKVFQAAYGTQLGMEQRNTNLMLDEESQQLVKDCAAFWILITIEVLELENVSDDDSLELTDTPSGKTLYIASPKTLEKIHAVVMSNDNSKFSCTFVAWTYVLSRIVAKASTLDNVPPEYQPFLDTINPPLTRSYTKESEPLHVQMTRAAIAPESGLFTLLHDLLTKSAPFVTSIAWRTGSAVREPNAIAYRSTLKGVVMALLELTPVEHIAPLDEFLDVWTALFGRSEPSAVSSLCLQFWQGDWPHRISITPPNATNAYITSTQHQTGALARRALIDVARTRFPIHLSPLMKLIRSMTGSGFLDTDPLGTSTGGDLGVVASTPEGIILPIERVVCARFVYQFFQHLPTFAQLIHLSQCSGPHAMYERVYNSHGSSSVPVYTNLRPLRLPGGSILPAKSHGTVVSDSGDAIVVAWRHQHSGWKLILDILGWYVRRRHMEFKSSSNSGAGGNGALTAADVSGSTDIFTRRGTHQAQNLPAVTISIEDVGMELTDQNDEQVVTDALDLLRSIVQSNPSQAEELMSSLEKQDPGSVPESPPDLVQLTTMILEEALSRTGARTGAYTFGSMNRNAETRSPVRMQLITSCLSVLAALLANPVYSNRVWLYIRSTSALFGGGGDGGMVSDKSYASTALAVERATGQYTVTLALLHLVQQLLYDAALTVQYPDPSGEQVPTSQLYHNLGAFKMQQVKEEVLMRAIRFVHSEIWIEHLGWKYNQLGDRFEIGRRIASLYSCVLINFPPSLPPQHQQQQQQQSKLFGKGNFSSSVQPKPYPLLSQAIADIMLLRATTSTITPLVSSLASGGQVVRMLHAARRFGDVRRLVMLLDSLLLLARQVINAKLCLQAESGGDRPVAVSLLEQALCARVVGGAASHDAVHSAKQDPIDVLAGYVKDRDIGADVPYQAIRLLTTLAKSLSVSTSSSFNPGSSSVHFGNSLAVSSVLTSSASTTATTMIGHLSNPEAVVSAFIGIVQHPYDDIDLRIAVWKFIALIVDVEPALGGLFVAGKFRIPGEFDVVDRKGKGKEGDGKRKEQEAEDEEPDERPRRDALHAAHDTLSHWRQLWEVQPELLAAVLEFMTIVWQHALEHKVSIEPLREHVRFWENIGAIVREEVGPVPEYDTEEYVVIDKVQHSNHNESVVVHSYRTLSKALAVKLVSLDVGFHLQTAGTAGGGTPPKRPHSFAAMEPQFKSEEELGDLLSEAVPSPYAPRLHDAAAERLKTDFPGLTLQQLQLKEPLSDRIYGDRFAFSMSLLQDRLHDYKGTIDADGMDDPIDSITKLVLSINLNLSLTHAQTSLTESWENLLRQCVPYLRPDLKLRASLLCAASSISGGIAMEHRRGEMMASIHGTRLALLLAIVEVAWFSSSQKTQAAETTPFLELVENLRDIVNNEAQNPVKSLMGALPNPFHRTLLQLLFFFAKEARILLNRPKALNADQRLTIMSASEAVLSLVQEGLRIVFVAAQSRRDVELDRDMELLVAVFEQCTKTDISPSSTYWLARCQEADVMRASLELFVRTDLSGLSDLPLLLSLKHPLYAPHILMFHMAVVSNPIAAERFASEGLLAAYSQNSISAAISAGRIDVVIPELPGERSPVHIAYCSMLSIVAKVVLALGRHNHYFDAEACGFVQLYGDQISRALSWGVGDSITMPGLEEMEQVVNLFYAIASSVPNSASASSSSFGSLTTGGVNPAVDKVLKVFTTHALLLLQQINYAITHPNHLGSVFEGVTQAERVQHERSAQVADPLKRPLVAQLVHRLFRLSSNVLGTLVVVSRADSVLCLPEEDWPVGEAVIIPHSKVVVGEPASLGTLLELGNCSLDILRDFVGRPGGQSLVPASGLQAGAAPGAPGASLDVRQGVVTARRSLESVLVYAVTQLAMWLAKSEGEPGSGGQDEGMDEQGMDGVSPLGLGGRGDGAGGKVGRSGGGLSLSALGGSVGASVHGNSQSGSGGGSGGSARAVSTSISMAERVRRGMTGEMASDLQALLVKAKPVMAKCDAVVGKESTDVMGILAVFVRDRVGAGV
ncbi:hypothetical protein FA15DRAFT_753049 [Coprinopsis marcescibilis]|uniref:Nucleoporin NUP188 n=1 Tax=Coprinopsis marcescibilis TaxID=230819 RepID=A0A5C3L923_COPMA|nr:hypothetical protein FA15DRAFT_753049 [Coprinopsis marcescibilis]